MATCAHADVWGGHVTATSSYIHVDMAIKAQVIAKARPVEGGHPHPALPARDALLAFVNGSNMPTTAQTRHLSDLDQRGSSA